MKLRLRGARNDDIEWTVGRIPAIAEMMMVDDQWYRVSNVWWAIRKAENGDVAYDVAVVLAESNPPPGTKAAESHPTDTP